MYSFYRKGIGGTKRLKNTALRILEAKRIVGFGFLFVNLVIILVLGEASDFDFSTIFAFSMESSF